MNRLILLILPIAIAGCSAASQAPATAPAAAEPAQIGRPTTGDLVIARQAGMHMTATLLYQGILPRAKGAGDLKELHYAEGIKLWAAAIPGLFPQGSEHPQSRAKADIWADKADFDRKATAMGAAADLVVAAAKAGDLKAYATAAEQVRQTCSSCHAAYRTD